MNLLIKLDSSSDSHEWNTVGHIVKTCPQQKKLKTGIREWCLHILRSRIKLQDICHTKYLHYHTSLYFLIVESYNSAMTLCALEKLHKK